ncbi:UDP-N-acetylglucosamine--LPS N-acetylglucosamine transferase [Janibacter sp. G56]|uniref:UDP-N-acetylglucosamine--LPS N-acetylglucosamine transferase n=1 Tax=Janibacter sp. G56 TaxID=3418717 RepID=UPI003D03F1E7
MPDRPPIPVVLATSNGVGMGHLTRQLTVALSAPETLDPILLSLSAALPTVAAAVAAGQLPELASRSVRSEYCPSRKSGWLPRRGVAGAVRRRVPQLGWEPYFRDRLRALVAETGARALVYDGVVPYDGLLAARRALPDTAFVWSRRGMWRAGVGADWLRHAGDFDLVIEPGDFAAHADRGATTDRDDATKVAPIAIDDVLVKHDRATARRALGLDPDRPALLLAPGAGVLGDVATPARAALAAVRELGPEWQVAVTSQAIAEHAVGGDAADHDRVVLLKGVYPLSRSTAAFDAAVGAAGYNAVHELLGAGVPTLLIPSATQTDDQALRARTLAADGVALVADADEGGSVAAGVARLLDPAVRDDLRAACAALPATDGGRAAARAVMDLVVDAPAGATRQPGGRPSLAGPWGPPAWRAALPDLRTPVALEGPGSTDRPRLAVTEELPTSLRDSGPVEHLVAGASPAYRAARGDIARWLYRS